jgi:hypothetical protein
MTRTSLRSIAATIALLWSGAALAIYQETTVTVTDQGKPVPGQTVTLTETEKPPQRDPQQPKPKPHIKRVVKLKTNQDGKIVVPVDLDDNRPGIYYDVTLHTSDGRSRTMRDIAIGDFILGGKLDFTNVPLTSATAVATAVNALQPVQPVRYMPSGLEIVIGVNVGGAESWNNYGNFPTFSGSGGGGGAFVVPRYYTQSGWFIGAEFGGMGVDINGRNDAGAFSKIQSIVYEGGQVGYRFGGGIINPVNVYVGVDAAQSRYNVGINADFTRDFPGESMTRTLNGWSTHGGFEVQPMPMRLPNLYVGFDYRYSYFSGRIGDDPVSGGVHFFSATATYQIPVGR